MADNKDYILEDIESIECLGPCEDDYVYDIEVDDETHTFIADDILVHNSAYTTYGDFFKCWTKESLAKIPTDKDKVQWILNFNENFLDDQNCKWCDEIYAPRHGKSVHKFEMETISRSGIYQKKKKYCKALSWSKGKWYDNPKVSGTGVELVKSTSPKLCKDIISDIVNSLMFECGTMPIDQYIYYFNNKMSEWKKKFWAADIESISQSIGVGAYKKYVLSDEGTLEFAKKAPVSVKCVGRYNYLAKKNGERNKCIYSGKIKYYNIRLSPKKGDTDYFGYPSGDLPKWAPPIDRQTQWQKNVIEPINRFLVVIDGLNEMGASGQIERTLFDL